MLFWPGLLVILHHPSLAESRILEPREPKIDAHLVDSVLADVVENSMSDLRQKLGLALRHVLFPDEQFHSGRKITEQEEQLVATFINQLIAERHQNLELPNRSNQPQNRFSTRVLSQPLRVDDKLKVAQLSDDPLDFSRSDEPPPPAPSSIKLDRRVMEKNSLMNSIHPIEPRLPGDGSQRISVALETITTKTPTKIVTVDELRYTDRALDDQPHASPSLLTAANRMPIWVFVFLIASFVFAGTACAVALIKTWKSKTRRSRALPRFPDPLTISGFTCAPNCGNGPGSFLERMKVAGNRGSGELDTRERDEETVWRTASSVRGRPI